MNKKTSKQRAKQLAPVIEMAIRKQFSNSKVISISPEKCFIPLSPRAKTHLVQGKAKLHLLDNLQTDILI